MQFVSKNAHIYAKTIKGPDNVLYFSYKQTHGADPYQTSGREWKGGEHQNSFQVMLWRNSR